MSNEITTARVREYRSNVELLLQPGMGGSRLERCVMIESGLTGKTSSPVNQIGPVKARRKTSRHSDTPIIETPHDRRWVTPVHYEWGDMLDKTDNLETGISFDGPYARNGANALNRSKDIEILKAFFGTAKTGEEAGTSTVFDTNNQVAVGGPAGLTYEKIIEGVRILMENHVDVDRDEIWCAITAKQHEDLLGEIEVISLDYNSKPVLEDGRVIKFAGVNFVHLEMGSVYYSDDDFSSTDSSGYRRVPMWAKSGMCLGIWDDLNVDIYKRPDKSNNTQVLCEGSYGATRLEEGKVVEILCSEA